MQASRKLSSAATNGTDKDLASADIRGIQADLYRQVVEGDMISLHFLEQHRDLLNQDIVLYGTINCNCIEKFELHPFHIDDTHEDMKALFDQIQFGECPHHNQCQDHICIGSKRLIHIAALAGHMWMLRYLADHGCDLNARTRLSQYTPILLAVKKINTEVIKFLLSHKVDMNIPSTQEQKTPLMEAVTSADAADVIVELLLTAEDIDVNSTNYRCETPLSVAVQNNETGLLDLLLKAKADCNIADRRGSTPLMHAAIHGNSKITRALIDSGSDLNVQNMRKETALLFATYRDDLDMVCQLLQAGADPDLCTDEGYSAMVIAAYDGSHNIIHLIIQHGGDVCKQNNQGYTALHISAWNGHVECLNTLLAANAPPDMQTNDKNTPLSLAAHGNHPAIIDVLLPLHCDVNNADKDLDTPLHYAAYNGHTETVMKFIAHGANPNSKNRINATPLWNAVLKNNRDIVKLMLRANVDLETASVGIDQHAQSEDVVYLYEQPVSPLWVSVNRNFPDLSLLLVAAGYDIYKEQWLTQNHFPDSLTKNRELLSLLTECVLTPPCLLKICRTQIRKILGERVMKDVMFLEVPSTLKNYLTLNDLTCS